MLWNETPVFIVDFEGSKSSGILEYGMVHLAEGKVIGTATRLCRPVGAVRPADTRLHGIAAESAADCAPFYTEWETFIGIRRQGPLGGHFTGAENHLLKAVWPYPPPSPDFARPGMEINDWGPWIDTGRLYGNLFPDLQTAALADLIALFGLQDELDALGASHCPKERRRFHAALYDALASALLLLSLARRDELACATLAWLLRMSCGKSRRVGLAQRRLWET